MTVKKAAVVLGVAPSTIHRLLNDGIIAGEQPTPGAPWRIRLTKELKDRFNGDAGEDFLPMREAMRARCLAPDRIAACQARRTRRRPCHARQTKRPAHQSDRPTTRPLRSYLMNQGVLCSTFQVGPQIKVEDPRLPLSYCFSHSLDRVVCCPLGPISIRPRLEVRLEHRFEDELERTLHHSVPDRRDRQDADFAPVFRYLLPPGWEWLVDAPGQFVAQLLEQSLHALRLDGLERDPVSSRGPIVLFFCLAIAYAARRVSI